MSEPTPTPKPISLRRALAVAVAVLVPVVPIVIGLLLSGGSSRAVATATPATTSTAAFTPAAAPRVRSTPVASVTPSGTGALVGLVRHTTAMHSRPGGRTFATIQSKTEFGSPTFLLVTKRDGPWLGVVSTAAGNNHLGWIRTSAVSLSRVHWELHAILSRHELVVSRDGRAIRHFTIAVGAPAAPTPTGHYAVTDRLNTGNPAGPYGCCILALSAKAPHHISDWNGGNRIAIHSTPETASIGHSVSHGCMRLSLAEGRWLLTHIPLGTPATISSA